MIHFSNSLVSILIEFSSPKFVIKYILLPTYNYALL